MSNNAFTTNPASETSIQTILNADVGDNGRSQWLWFRFPNGDLVFGCFPRGDAYFETENDHHSDYKKEGLTPLFSLHLIDCLICFQPHNPSDSNYYYFERK